MCWRGTEVAFVVCRLLMVVGASPAMAGTVTVVYGEAQAHVAAQCLQAVHTVLSACIAAVEAEEGAPWVWYL